MWSVLGFIGVLAVLAFIETLSDGLTGYDEAVEGKMSRGARLAHESTYVFAGMVVMYATTYFFF